MIDRSYYELLTGIYASFEVDFPKWYAGGDVAGRVAIAIANGYASASR